MNTQFRLCRLSQFRFMKTDCAPFNNTFETLRKKQLCQNSEHVINNSLWQAAVTHCRQFIRMSNTNRNHIDNFSAINN